MITEKQLDTLKTFGREEDGEYCDRWKFSIKKSENDSWGFYFFNEVDGSLFFIKRLKDFDDLKNIYHAITDMELE